MKIKFLLSALICSLINYCQGAALNKELSQNEYQLFKAINDKDIPKIKKLIDSGVNVNVVNHTEIKIPDLGGMSNTILHQNMTPLIFAFYFTLLPIAGIKLLLNAGANINAQDDDGYTPLSTFIHWLGNYMIGKKEAIEILELLSDYGANPEVVNRFGQPAMGVAKEKYENHLKTLKLESNTRLKEQEKKYLDLYKIIIILLDHQKKRAQFAGKELHLLGLPPEVAAVAQSYLAPGNWEKNIKRKTQGPPGGPAMDLSQD